MPTSGERWLGESLGPPTEDGAKCFEPLVRAMSNGFNPEFERAGQVLVFELSHDPQAALPRLGKLPKLRVRAT